MTTLNIPTDQVRDFLNDIVDEEGIDSNTIEAIATRLGIELETGHRYDAAINVSFTTDTEVTRRQVTNHLLTVLRRNQPIGVQVSDISVNIAGFTEA